jgi:hypothetical protein
MELTFAPLMERTSAPIDRARWSQRWLRPMEWNVPERLPDARKSGMSDDTVAHVQPTLPKIDELRDGETTVRAAA